MQLGVQLPQELDATHKAKLDKLSSLSGGPFERQFKTDQVEGHKQAIAQFERYAKSGDNPDLKKWAQETLPTLKTHLQHAEALPRPNGAPTVGSGTRR
jgi:putative membrane protein